ncbi:MAG: OsmC family peroxiredoxin [Gemmatimonadetes bacterium]|nr:MAG: OsmC family peroxiredoxin [Gemmatimonadota bacterium]
MTGTFGGALEARGIDASEGRLRADVVGEVEKDEGVLVIRRIRVTYHLDADLEHAEMVRRVHDMHAERCPVYRTLAGCIDITTELPGW